MSGRLDALTALVGRLSEARSLAVDAGADHSLVSEIENAIATATFNLGAFAEEEMRADGAKVTLTA